MPGAAKLFAARRFQQELPKSWSRRISVALVEQRTAQRQSQRFRAASRASYSASTARRVEGRPRAAK